MDYVIHEGTMNDASLIGKFVYSLLVEAEHHSPNMTEAFYSMKAAEFLQRSPPNYVFIARDRSGKALGLITIAVSSAIYAEGTFGVINELYVLPQLRSASIGKVLLDETKLFAASKGWTRLEVTATSEQINPRSARFYEREGFEESGLRLKFELRQKQETR